MFQLGFKRRAPGRILFTINNGNEKAFLRADCCAAFTGALEPE
jgi:hypothetical protein